MKRAYWISLLLLLSSCQRPPVTGPPPTDRGNADRLAGFEMKKTCFEVGRRLYESEFKTPGAGLVALNPLYAYSKALNTCVMYAGFVGKGKSGQFLIDALSNTEIASSIRAGSDTVGLSKEEFQRRKKAFFPEVP